MLLAVDPGIRGCGVALFDGERLVCAAYVKNPAKSGNGPEECVSMGSAVARWALARASMGGLAAVVVEWPRVYTAGKLEGDPNDLLALVGVDCAVVASLGVSSVRYHPEQWKGQTPKDVMNARVDGRLTVEERSRIEPHPESLRHNVLDGIGIGLHHVGRLARRRVIAR